MSERRGFNNKFPKQQSGAGLFQNSDLKVYNSLYNKSSDKNLPHRKISMKEQLSPLGAKGLSNLQKLRTLYKQES